jgi:hypothetical protein
MGPSNIIFELIGFKFELQSHIAYGGAHIA